MPLMINRRILRSFPWRMRRGVVKAEDRTAGIRWPQDVLERRGRRQEIGEVTGALDGRQILPEIDEPLKSSAR